MKNLTNIYILEIPKMPKDIKKKVINKFINIIPKDILEKFNRKKNIEKKTYSMLAYIMLFYILNRKYKWQNPPKLYYNKNNKPYIKYARNIFFNISHTKNIILCAVSNKEIGIDIERIRKIDFNLAKKVCTKFELFKLIESKKKDEMFFRIWTRKESYCKKIGGSIFKKYKLIESFFINNILTFSYKKFIISLAFAKKQSVKLKIFNFF